MIRQKNEGFIGMKLVRWHHGEKKITERNTPICSSKEATDANYDAAVRYMIDHLEIMLFFAGTTMKRSTYNLMELMQSKEYLLRMTEFGFSCMV
jgi:proline dehydrogenase